MASEEERGFDAAMAALTAPGGMLAVARDREGRAYAGDLPGTLAGFLRFACAQYGDAEALVSGGERLSFAALDALSERLAGALAGGHGVKPGDRVAIAMRNAPAWMLVYMAAAKAGAVVTLLNGWWTPDELAHALALAEPALIVADAERARRIAAAGSGARIVTLPVERPAGEALAPLLDGAAPGPLPAIAPEDDATILFTSGSTGRARGAVSSQRAVTTGIYTFLAITAAVLQHYHGGDRANLPGPPAVLVAVPLFHVTGEIPVFLTSLALGRKMVLMPRWDASEALRLIEAEKISYFIGVPTMSLELLQHPERDRYDTSTLTDIAAGGAPRPVAHVPRLKAAFPAGSPMIGYGLTETNAVGCTNFRGNYLRKPASAGRAQAPWVEIGIFADGRALPQGETGEIGIRTAANARGYWRDPAASRAAFTPDGYFLTGDLGYLDEDGYLFIVDRAKDIILRGGENISCLEVEAALYAHPAVAEASVFALADERLGEVPGAVVHPKPGEAVEADALLAFLAEHIARFKLPERLWLAPEPLPRLGTGKIDKKALRALYGGA